MKEVRPEPKRRAGAARPVGGVALGTALLAVAALPLAGARNAPPLRVVMPGLAPAYAERVPAAKAELLRVINRERAEHGAPPLAYDLLGAKVGDEFCDRAARDRTTGHWDLEGRAPYLRWALAGGIDHHAQNFAAESRTGFEFTESPAELLLRMHAAFMAEKPPNDGHRRTILDPIWTHVGIGFALVGGELRMTEEYSRRVLEWAELPAGPVRAGGGRPARAEAPEGVERRGDRGGLRAGSEADVAPRDRGPRLLRAAAPLADASPLPSGRVALEVGRDGRFSGERRGPDRADDPARPGARALLRRRLRRAGDPEREAALPGRRAASRRGVRVQHLLVSSRRDRLADDLRALLPPSSVLLTARGIDATLERLGRSARVDAVVTDDAAVLSAIREEVPGGLPVVLVDGDTSASEVLRRVEEALGEP